MPFMQDHISHVDEPHALSSRLVLSMIIHGHDYRTGEIATFNVSLDENSDRFADLHGAADLRAVQPATPYHLHPAGRGNLHFLLVRIEDSTLGASSRGGVYGGRYAALYDPDVGHLLHLWMQLHVNDDFVDHFARIRLKRGQIHPNQIMENCLFFWRRSRDILPSLHASPHHAQSLTKNTET